MIPPWFSLPLRFLPQPFTAVSLGVVLNLFFQRHVELRERMRELSGKVFRFRVEDLDQEFFMVVEESGEVLIHTYSDDEPHVEMAGESTAFIALLLQMEDPDSLFFSRRLKLSGETDTGLRFKNILDNVEIDWRQELAALVGEPVAGVLAGMGEKVATVAGLGKEKATAGVEEWLAREGAPRMAELEAFRAAVDEMTRRTGQLDKAVSRLQKKRAVKS